MPERAGRSRGLAPRASAVETGPYLAVHEEDLLDERPGHVPGRLPGWFTLWLAFLTAGVVTFGIVEASSEDFARQRGLELWTAARVKAGLVVEAIREQLSELKGGASVSGDELSAPSATRGGTDPAPPADDRAPPPDDETQVMWTGTPGIAPDSQEPVLDGTPVDADDVADESRDDGADETLVLATQVPRAGRRSARGTGFLRLNARPWAEVYVDDKFVGHTPQTLLELTAGRHEIRLENAEFNLQKTLSIRIRSGATKTRIVNLLDDAST